MEIDVVCAIIFFGDRILVTQRSERMNMPLKWEFPGGKVDKGESEIECIKREILEEINIEIEVGKRLVASLHKYPTFTINLIPYIANHLRGEIRLAEHSEYRLLRIGELEGLDWAEADVAIVRQLLVRGAT
jgi:8-oxo-dGTP diphosphatase